MPTSCPPLPAARRILGLIAGVAWTALSSIVQAQEPPSRSSLGIRGIGALGVYAGYAHVERGLDAGELSGTLDLGHFSSRRVRLRADVSFLRTGRFRAYVAADDTTYRNVFYDLSGMLNLAFALRDPTHRVVPFVSFGTGIHVLTSSFGSIPIDLRYNTNVFGLQAASGVRIRAGHTGRRAVVIEGGATLAKEVSRASVRLGTEWLFGDLRRPR